MRLVRAAGYAAYFFVTVLVFGLAGIFVRVFARGRALRLAQAWARVALAGLRPVCGIGVEISGWHHLPREGAALLASQHQSEFDTMIWMRQLARPSYVLKRELLRIPLFGPMLVPAGMIPVDRAAGAGALRRLLLDCAAAREAGRQIVIFPEGTRVAPGERGALQPGIVAIAARLGMPVIPIATDSGRFWARGALGKYAGTIHIAIGPPIAPGAGRDALLAEIEGFWRSCEINGFGPVDNSVGRSVGAPANQARGTG